MDESDFHPKRHTIQFGLIVKPIMTHRQIASRALPGTKPPVFHELHVAGPRDPEIEVNQDLLTRTNLQTGSTNTPELALVV
jgi:hypothetical protein